MASLDSLPPDQRAVIQLVLQRGRSYDEIAAILGIDRAAVRRRALDGFDALGPSNAIPAPQRALVTDYLLGQLPPRVADGVRERLASSPPDRAWARVVSAEIAELTTAPLPEIPVGSTRPAYPPPPEPEPEPAPDAGSDAPEPSFADFADEPTYGSWSPRESDAEPAALAVPRPPARTSRPARPREERPSSRLGGVIVLGSITVVVVAIVVVLIIVGTGGSSPHHGNTTAGNTGPPTGAASTPTTGSTTTPASTSTSTTATKLLAQIDLTSPTGDKRATGLAQVVRSGSLTGIVIVATGVPANTKADAYAVWLYSSPKHADLLGFVSALVNSTGKLQTEGKLPGNARSYHQVLLTLETQGKPTHPGEVVLQGSLSLS